MGTFNIWTIGCQMNTSDARKLSEELEGEGFSETDQARSADLVVLYSCMVRQHAEDKVRSKLGELRLLKKEKPDQRLEDCNGLSPVEASATLGAPPCASSCSPNCNAACHDDKPLHRGRPLGPAADRPGLVPRALHPMV